MPTKSLKDSSKNHRSNLEKNYKNIALLASEIDQTFSIENIENSEILKHVFYCLMGALFPTNNVDRLKEKRDSIFSKLVNVWPDNAEATKNALLTLIGETPRVS